VRGLVTQLSVLGARKLANKIAVSSGVGAMQAPDCKRGRGANDHHFAFDCANSAAALTTHAHESHARATSKR
jgi:hypothetical protein